VPRRRAAHGVPERQVLAPIGPPLVAVLERPPARAGGPTRAPATRSSAGRRRVRRRPTDLVRRRDPPARAVRRRAPRRRRPRRGCSARNRRRGAPAAGRPSHGPPGRDAAQLVLTDAPDACKSADPRASRRGRCLAPCGVATCSCG
jgi:hypothetical protein